MDDDFTRGLQCLGENSTFERPNNNFVSGVTNAGTIDLTTRIGTKLRSWRRNYKLSEKPLFQLLGQAQKICGKKDPNIQ